MASPIIKPQKAEHLDFYEAIKKMVDGHKLTKIEWEDMTTYGYLRNGVLTLHKGDTDYQWIVSDGDINGTDWIVLEESN